MTTDAPRSHRQDPWADLRAYTSARLAIGRSGNSLPTEEILRFGLAHAQARDAVWQALDLSALERELEALNMRSFALGSAAPDRGTYLARPDLGRRLSVASARELDKKTGGSRTPCDLAIVIGDGLSSLGVQRNAAPLLEQILAMAPSEWTLGPVVLVTQARVALGDEIGERMNARLVAVLIGERPGLSSPDSLGIYLTAAPRVGRTDAERNCISNIRPGGLDYRRAAARFWWLCQAALGIGATGVALGEDSNAAEGRLAIDPDARSSQRSG